MAKAPSKNTLEILDQIAKARQALDYFDNGALNPQGDFQDGTTVRARLNAAKAHLIRAMEKAQPLK